jgi:hypothetical protein
MNIFCLHDVVWGLARMKVTKSILEMDDLNDNLLRRIVSLLHTFLPVHYSDVMWSLGSMRYTREDFTVHEQDRILAIMSRVLLKLTTRAATYVLWGLGKMSFNWSDDFLRPVKSLPQGDDTIPLAHTVIKYYRSNLAHSNEKELSTLLYSFGELKMPWDSLSPNVKVKVYAQFERFSGTIRSRDIANALMGIARCGISWSDIPPATQAAIIAAIAPNNPSDGLSNFRGLARMNHIELSQTISSFGLMNVTWDELPSTVQGSLLAEINSKASTTPLHNRCDVLWGFAAMGVPKAMIPLNLLSSLIKDLQHYLQESPESSQKLPNELTTALKAMSKLRIEFLKDETLSSQMRLKLTQAVISST